MHCQITPPLPYNNKQLPATSDSKKSICNNSVIAARKDVQSTAELVAQLTENLPQNMTIDLNKLETDKYKSLTCDNKNSIITTNLSVTLIIAFFFFLKKTFY